MAAKVPIYCADSCSIIDWLRETEGREQVKAMSLLISDVEQGNCKMVLSAAVLAELLPGNCGPRYPDFLRQISSPPKNLARSLVVQAVDIPIARMTAELREDLGIKGAGKTVDAMMLATAIYSGADALYTGDNDLLTLNERVAALTRNQPAAGFKIKKIEEHLKFRSRELPLVSEQNRSGGGT